MKTIFPLGFLFMVICFSFSSCKKDKDASERRLVEYSFPDSQWKMEFKYDSSNRLISTHGGIVTLFYNNQGQLAKYNDGYVIYAFDHDSKGRIIKRTPISVDLKDYHPDTIEYYYDGKDRVVKSISTFNDPVSRPGWTRYYYYNDQDDIEEYRAFHAYYNQSENETFLYDKALNPLNIGNGVLFFLNEYAYDALNKHCPKRKDDGEYTTVYTYDFAYGLNPRLQTIRTYERGQPLDPFGPASIRQVRFRYEEF